MRAKSRPDFNYRFLTIHFLKRKEQNLTQDALAGIVAPQRLLTALDEGCVAVVAGFQGIDAEGDISTLGRGGSDTTAVALAAALNADRCEIYTDVDGIYTADPRLVTGARLLREIDYLIH